MEKILLCSAMSLVLIGCGQNIVGSGKKKSAADISAACPASLRQPLEEITVFFGGPMPGRLAVDIAGQRRYSECTTLPAAPPFVRVERLSGNRLAIKLQRLLNRRADEVVIGVKDLKDCNRAEDDLMKEERIVPRYTMEFPDGPKCPGQPVAKMELIR